MIDGVVPPPNPELIPPRPSLGRLFNRERRRRAVRRPWNGRSQGSTNSHPSGTRAREAQSARQTPICYGRAREPRPTSLASADATKREGSNASPSISKPIRGRSRARCDYQRLPNHCTQSTEVPGTRGARQRRVSLANGCRRISTVRCCPARRSRSSPVTGREDAIRAVLENPEPELSFQLAPACREHGHVRDRRGRPSPSRSRLCLKPAELGSRPRGGAGPCLGASGEDLEFALTLQRAGRRTRSEVSAVESPVREKSFIPPIVSPCRPIQTPLVV